MDYHLTCKYCGREIPEDDEDKIVQDGGTSAEKAFCDNDCWDSYYAESES